MATAAGTWPAIDGGRPHFSADSFFFLRVPNADVDTSGQEAQELAHLAGYRWWTLVELRAPTVPAFPPGLGGLVSALLRDGPPPRPARLPSGKNDELTGRPGCPRVKKRRRRGRLSPGASR